MTIELPDALSLSDYGAILGISGSLAIFIGIAVAFMLSQLLRWRVVREMNRSTEFIGGRTVRSPADPPPDATSASVTLSAASLPPGRDRLRRATRYLATTPWRAALSEVAGGILYAAITASVMYVTSTRIHGQSAASFSLTVWAAYFTLLCAPVVLNATLIVTGRRKTSLLAALFCGAPVVAMAVYLRESSVLVLWAVPTAIPMLLVSIFQMRRLRAIGPSVFLGTWLVIAAAFAGLLFEAGSLFRAADPQSVALSDILAIVSHEDAGTPLPPRTPPLPETVRGLFRQPQHIDAIVWKVACATLIPALLIGLLAWKMLRRQAQQYRDRKASEQMILLESVRLVFVISLCVTTISMPGQGWVAPAAIGGLLVWRSVANGLRPHLVHRWHKPFRLLLLRAFRPAKRSDDLVDALASSWRYVGPIRLIAGPDFLLPNLEPHELYDFLSGRLGGAFIADESHLLERLAAIDDRADPDGRHRAVDFYCREDMWRTTVEHLMQESDVVLMDIRGAEASTGGIRFELELLVQTVRAEQVVILMDGDEELLALERVIAQ